MARDFQYQQNKLSIYLADSNSSADDAFPLAVRKQEINDGELQFALQSKSLLGYVTGTVSSQAISLPSDYLGMHVLVLDDITLTSEYEMPIQDYDIYVNSGEDRYYYWVDASNVRKINLITSNSNGQTYRLYYFRKPSVDLTEATDESPFLDEYRLASVYYAAGELLPQIGKLQLAAYYTGKFAAMAMKAQEEVEKRTKSVVKANPEIFDVTQFDNDIQGQGAQGGVY